MEPEPSQGASRLPPPAPPKALRGLLGGACDGGAPGLVAVRDVGFATARHVRFVTVRRREPVSVRHRLPVTVRHRLPADPGRMLDICAP
ncbi:hypothetical protein GCM10010521_64360 [Streptomyces rameus]|uniref:Uncharacterized protein n=1 Tax=Streptomyces rameus TaxID=68261 RepID=A0ABN3V393_9ACTN